MQLFLRNRFQKVGKSLENPEIGITLNLLDLTSLKG